MSDPLLDIIQSPSPASPQAQVPGKMSAPGEPGDPLLAIVGVTAQQQPTQAPAKQSVGTLANAWDGVKNLGIGLYRGVMDPIDGGAQLAAHGVASAVHSLAPGSSADKFFADQAHGVDAINTNREKQYQELTPGSVAAGVGRVGGNIIVPVKGTQAARGAGFAQKLASGVTTGAVVGAAQPVLNAGDRDLSSLITGQEPIDYWSEKAKQVGLGAALGGGLSTLASALGATNNALRPVLSPKAAVGDQLVKGLAKAKAAAQANPSLEGTGSLPSLTGSRDPRDVLARLQSAAPLVEGSLPTTAQVAGVPELVMAEKTLKNNPAYRGPFEDRAIANNQARLAQLLKVAKTPADLQAAIDARTAETKPLYDAARAAELPVDEALGSLLARPSSQAAIARGKKLAAERGEQVGLDSGAPAASATSSILDVSGKPFADMVPARPASISGNMLQYLKMGLDDLQSEGRTQGIGSHEAKALSDTQDVLRQWMERNSPDFSKANAAYAKASQPINTMQAAQDLYGGLSNGTLNAAGDVAPALSQYRTQLAKALKNSPYGIDPEGQKTLEAIQQDLQRESISNSIKSPGSDTFFNAQAPNWLAGKIYGDSLDGKSWMGKSAAALGAFLAGSHAGPAAGIAASAAAVPAAEKLGQFVGNRVNTEFQNAMLDPQYFAKLLGDALDRQASDPSTFQKLAPAWMRGATAGAENVLSPNP